MNLTRTMPEYVWQAGEMKRRVLPARMRARARALGGIQSRPQGRRIDGSAAIIEPLADLSSTVMAVETYLPVALIGLVAVYFLLKKPKTSSSTSYAVQPVAA